jgi:hypothetical protein
MDSLVVTPDLGIPIPQNIDYADLITKASAACATVRELESHGLEVNVTQGDIDIATAIVTAYAADPEKVEKTVTPAKLATLPPGALLKVEEILGEMAHPIVKHAMQIRHLVTNGLVIETKSSNPNVRLRAYELLGKFAEVGLFTEKQEITVTHQSTDDLRKKLREKLDKIMGKNNEVQDVVEINGEVVNVKEELGVETPKDE